MGTAIFTKPKRPAPFGFAPTKPKTEASIWRGSTRDVSAGFEQFHVSRITAVRVVKN